MKEEIEDYNSAEYIRVGTSLLKRVKRPLISGDFIMENIPWSYETLRQDFSKDNMPTIEKYDGFCIIPNNIDYKKVHGTYLNQYEPINHTPREGDFPNIRMFLEHIFGEQLNYGFDYLKLLYLKPTQILPILLFVSNHRGTGKTTMLRLVKSIFGKNATFNSNEDFRSSFNSHWVNKLVVLVDELLLDKNEDLETIKNISTAGDYKIESKGKDRREIEIFCKIILCSNNENNPVIIPQEEIRFWVRKIPKIKFDNVSLREDMKKEIPHFLHFLIHREFSTRNESRMWFNPTLLETAALRKIKRYNCNKTETEMANYCKDVMDYKNQESVSCCAKDFLDVIRDTGIKTDITHIRTILKNNWGLNSEHNGDYTFFIFGKDGELIPQKRKGRYVIVTLVLVNKILL